MCYGCRQRIVRLTQGQSLGNFKDNIAFSKLIWGNFDEIKTEEDRLRTIMKEHMILISPGLSVMTIQRYQKKTL